MKSKHTLVIGDCLEVLRDPEIIHRESISLAVTSPPYGLRKDYGGMYTDTFDINKWRKMISSLAEVLKEVLTKNGSFFLNVSPIPHPKTSEIVPLDCVAYSAIKEHGFFLRNKIMWTFNNMQNTVRRLSGRWEAILWFVKDIKNYTFNLNDIRIPYITVGDKRLTGTGRNPTDVWYFDRVNNMTKAKLKIDFPAVFPDPMIERIITMSSKAGDVILDPFLGSGTVMKVAKTLGRNCIGIEINPKYVDLIKRRVEPEKWTIHGPTSLEIIRHSLA